MSRSATPRTRRPASAPASGPARISSATRPPRSWASPTRATRWRAPCSAFSILGSQPFGPAATDFRALSGRLRTLAGDATTLSSELGQDGADLSTIVADLQDLRARLQAVSSQLDGLDPRTVASTLLWALVMLLGLTIWLGVGALACAWIGWRIRRSAVGPAALDG